MEPLRIVFMGTPAFAVPSLRALLGLGEVAGRPAQVVGVFTQPDRPGGRRGRQLAPPPVKEEAQKADVPVWQPERLRRAEGMEPLRALAPDLIVVAAYAQILSQQVLDLPRYGCLNVHASLLPRYRGAAPIQAAILNGDMETGVCIMQMEAGLDTGPVLDCVREQIRPDDTAESLGDRLATLGADLLARTVPAWVAGAIEPRQQDDNQATLTSRMRKEDGEVDWRRDAAFIERQVRAMYPWPGAYTMAGGALLKLLRVGMGHDQLPSPPGTVAVDPGSRQPLVATGAGYIRLDRVQPAGRTPMTGAEWLRGAPAMQGAVLGAVSVA